MSDRLLSSQKKVVVTGMGFALPGESKANNKRDLCTNKEQFWKIISNGISCIENEGVYYGFINKSKEELMNAIKYVPKKYLRNYNLTHLLSIIACQEACDDAGLSIADGDLKNAGIISARTSISSNIESFLEFLNMDHLKASPKETLEMFNRLMISVPINDAAMVQAAMLRSGNVQFGISCGCASGNIAVGLAQKTIMSGEADVVVVTGVESMEKEIIQQYVMLVNQAEKTQKTASFSAPPTKFILDKLMAPYDKKAEGYNSGIGAATIILESEKHALQRNAHIYGEIVNQCTMRNDSPSAVSLDESGIALVNAVKKCLKDKITVSDIGYVNGGAQGDRIFNIFESNALNIIFGEKVNGLPVTSQEGCFGHNSSVLGITGIAGTMLMIEKGQICPTAGCNEVDEVCLFNPLPGNQILTKNIDYALSFNYQAGGVCSVVLLGRYKNGNK